jgi:hypothetical protein
MEENINQDTPQAPEAQPVPSGVAPENAFDAPVNEGSSSDNLSVEDAFFGSTETNDTTAPTQDLPVETQGQDIAPVDNKNDAKRYEYWQSQAAQRENELQQLKAQMDQVQQQQTVQAQQAQQAAPEQESFPPPPPRPQKPRGFSREEAWSDPSSESARYLDEMDDWNDNINEYRDIRSQYEVALVREQMEAQEAQRQAVVQKQQQKQAFRSQVKEVYDHVTGHYGLTPDEGKEFVQTMSTPESISMDNLVQLYRMQKGAPVQNTASQGPSETFQQSRNAQQIPSPMGVMPAQAPSNRSESDSIMDDIITDFKDRNPWGN